jgi:hypothetical protein
MYRARQNPFRLRPDRETPILCFTVSGLIRAALPSSATWTCAYTPLTGAATILYVHDTGARAPPRAVGRERVVNCGQRDAEKAQLV